MDLEAVESAVLDSSRRFQLIRCVYDPYQAELMAQRLRRHGISMEPMVFAGKNLNTMATTLLEVFQSGRIELYGHRRLLSDLGRLRIVEKSFGHKLESTRDADGHADTAIALAIALPSATELLRNDYLYYDDENFICSGEDPVEERRRITEEEMDDLPEYLRDILQAHRDHGAEYDGWDDF